MGHLLARETDLQMNNQVNDTMQQNHLQQNHLQQNHLQQDNQQLDNLQLDNQPNDIILLIMMLLDPKSLFRFIRCSHRYYNIGCDETFCRIKLKAEYQITTDLPMSSFESYKFCLYAGRKKSTGYDLFMINEMKELKAQKVDTAQRLSQSQAKWKTLSIESKNQWKKIAADPGHCATFHSLWLALSAKERDKFGKAAANQKRINQSTVVYKKKNNRKHKKKDSPTEPL